MMRNEQLIRQWKILRYVAEGQFDLVDLGMPELRAVFNVSHKTIRRDVAGLRDAGFFEEYHFKPGSWGKRKKLRIKNNVHAVVRTTVNRARKDIAEADLLQCNSCPYRFKTVAGRLDVADFRAHKKLHA